VQNFADSISSAAPSAILGKKNADKKWPRYLPFL
jgi:hypothetical protein